MNNLDGLTVKYYICLLLSQQTSILYMGAGTVNLVCSAEKIQGTI